MSSPETPTPSSPSTIDPQPESSRAGVRPLKREAIVMANDRGRLGMLVALCALAGVVVGFGLSNMAASMRMYRCPVDQVSTVHSQGVRAAAAPVETPTWLGVRITTARQGGAYVQEVEARSPAHTAGIRKGDVIVGFSHDGCPKRVSKARDLIRLVRSAAPGNEATLVLHRGDEKQVVHPRLERMPMSLFLEEIR